MWYPSVGLAVKTGDESPMQLDIEDLDVIPHLEASLALPLSVKGDEGYGLCVGTYPLPICILGGYVDLIRLSCTGK